jgi:TonB family protein
MENAATALGYQFVHVDAASACVLLGMRQPVLTDEGIPPFCPGECDKPNRGLSPPLRSGWETRLSSVAGDISENIDADEVVARVRQSLAGVKHCYESQLQNNPFLQGTVTVAFTIAPSGDVGSCAITENTVPSAVVADCIRRRVQRWRMVSPREGTATVSYSFVFTTAKKPPGHKEIKSELNAKRRATCKAMGR